MKRLNQKLFFFSLFLTLGLALSITASFLIEPEVVEITPLPRQTSSGERIAALVGGNQPTALDVSPDGRYFIYSNFLDGNLTMCEITL